MIDHICFDAEIATGPKKKGQSFLTKAIKTGLMLLIDWVAAAIFVRWKKVPDFGTSERFFIQSTMSFNKVELLHNFIWDLFSKHIAVFYYFMLTIDKIIPVSIALIHIIFFQSFPFQLWPTPAQYVDLMFREQFCELTIAIF